MGSPKETARSPWRPRTEIEYWMIIYGIGSQIRIRERIVLSEIEEALLRFLPREITKLSTANLCELQKNLIFSACCARADLKHPQRCHPLNMSNKRIFFWEEWNIRQQRRFVQKLSQQQSICFLGPHSS